MYEVKYVYSTGSVFGTVVKEQEKKVCRWIKKGCGLVNSLQVVYTGKVFILCQTLICFLKLEDTHDDQEG